MSKVLVFGSEGFVGRYLIFELQHHKYDVVASDCLDSAATSHCKQYCKVDLTDSAQVASCIEGVQPDAIVNLAAISSVGMSWKAPQLTFQVNIVGTTNILEAVRSSSNRDSIRILLVGSGESYKPSLTAHRETDPLDASSPYGISKSVQDQVAELYIKEFGLQICRVRPFNHTGVGQKESFVIPSWCKQAAEISLRKREPIIYVGNTEVERDFSDVRDVVRAYRLVLEHGLPGSVYNIGSGRCVPLATYLEMILGLTGLSVKVEKSQRLFRPSDNPRSACDATCIERDLGWRPAYRIEETIKEIYASMVE